MTEVKICGMQSLEDLDHASKADYVGFVVETGTRRSLSVARAKELISSATAKKVVVTTSIDPVFLEDLVSTLEPDVLQVHSPIDYGDLEQVSLNAGCLLWSVVPIGGGGELMRAMELRELVDALVLDTASAEGGGAGVSHDWNLSAQIKAVTEHPVVLSGGLAPRNVGEAIERMRPEVVDVSSGVEENGLKSSKKISEFIAAVRRVGI
jgi:phosphoribosylanthranilate isomerase